jgi:hypothetical protein
MPYEIAIRFAAVFVSAKLMSLRLPFYSAALLAVASAYCIEGLANRGNFAPVTTQVNVIRLGAALVLFYFLDKHEDKRIRWSLGLLLTFSVLTFVIK